MLKWKYVGPGFKQLNIQKNPALMFKSLPSAAFTPPGFGFVYFKIRYAALSLISKSSQFIQLLKQGLCALENLFTALDWRPFFNQLSSSP